METLVPILAFAAVLALVGSIILIVRRADARRSDQLYERARRLKFEFSKVDDANLRQRLSHFHLFSQGHSRKLRNAMAGRAGDLDIVIFDYRYTVGGGKSSSTWRQTVALFETGDAGFPTFSMRPEHIFHKIGGLLGFQDIDFDSHPRFSKKYLLRGDKEIQVRRLFPGHVLSHFEVEHGLGVEAAGGQLVYYRPGKRVKPEHIPHFIKDAVKVFAMFRTQSK